VRVRVCVCVRACVCVREQEIYTWYIFLCSFNGKQVVTVCQCYMVER